jgi:hypothetical protein
LAESTDVTYALKGLYLTEDEGDYAVAFHMSKSNVHYFASEFDQINSPLLVNHVRPKITATDLLIITQNQFIESLTAYINDKQSQGMRVQVVDVESLYLYYGDSNHDPKAIKEFIKQSNKLNPLSYVMLVGSDQYDYKNHLNSSAYSVVPTFYRDTGSGIYYAPTDTPFVDLDNDFIAEIAIGRLPVNSVTELENLLAKITSYQSNEHTKELIVTDNVDAFNFSAIAEQLAINSPLEVQIVNSYEEGVTQANAQLLTALNSGVDFVNWIGHSSSTRWSRDNIFDIADVNALQNPSAIFFQLGCWNTYFVDPINQNLANALLQKETYGAVATIGSSTYTKTDGEKKLAMYFNEYINNQPSPTIGKALNYALKQYGANNPERKDILLGYQLLGDPTMVVRR